MLPTKRKSAMPNCPQIAKEKRVKKRRQKLEESQKLEELLTKKESA
jgi:hypothetical protein